MRNPSRSPSIAVALSLVVPLLATSACKPTETTAPEATDAPAQAEAPLPRDQILAASNLPGVVESPLDGDDMGVTIHRLSNGLTVYISTDRQQPRISSVIGLRTGSRNDPADSTGLAHYLEHMLFKGTDQLGTLDYEKEKVHLDKIEELYAALRSTDDSAERTKIFEQIDAETQASAAYAIPNELDRLYAAMGIEGVNAYTSYDVTGYICDLPSNRVEAWTQIEGERFADPAFRLFYPELEAVYEEKNRTMDSPEYTAYSTMLSKLFPQHPYGTQTTIGEVDHLKSPAYGDMVAYFDRWYVPNNMAVVLAGDVDAETVLPMLEATLGKLEPKALEAPTPGTIEPLKGRVATEIVAEGEQSVTLAWQTVPAAHPDRAALEVMDFLMDNSKTGLLNVELELAQVVPNAGSSPTFMHEAGYWEMEATAKDGQSLDEVEKLLLGVVAKLQAGDFTQEDIDAVVLQGLMREKLSLEFRQARSSKMVQAFVNRMEWSEVLALDAAKEKVTKEDVMRVAKQYLGGDYVALYRKRGKPELPKIEKPKISPVEIDTTRRSDFAKQVSEIPTPPLEPYWLEAGKDYAVGTLPAGRLITSKNEANDLFQLSYDFDRGSRDAKLLCVAFELLERSGTKDMSAEALQRKLYAMGSSIDFSCGDDGMQIGLRGLDAKLEDTLSVLNEWMATANFEQETLDKLVENEISERRDNLEDPRFLSYALRQFAMYGKDSSLFAEPSNQQLQGAKAKALAKLVSTAPNFEHTTSYFGPRDAAALGESIALGSKHKKTKGPHQNRYRKTKTSELYFLGKDVAKSSVSFVLPLGALEAEYRPVAHLLGEYFGGGMSSVVFQEIREARGLAYFARAYFSSGNVKGDDWGFLGMMDTQSDKTVDALTLFLEIAQTRKLDESRVSEAKERAEQGFRADRTEPRFVTSLVEYWYERGDEKDPRPELRKAVGELDGAQLQTFADRLDGVPLLISVLGNKEGVDLEGLRKAANDAKLVEVEASALTSWGKFPARADDEAGKAGKADGQAAN